MELRLIEASSLPVYTHNIYIVSPKTSHLAFYITVRSERDEEATRGGGGRGAREARARSRRGGGGGGGRAGRRRPRRLARPAGR